MAAPAGTPARSCSQRQLAWRAVRLRVSRSGRCMARAVTGLVLRVEIGLGRFPVGPVEGFDREFDPLIQAVRVDAPRFGVRARLVEAFDAAMAAEQMLGGAG